MVFSNSSTSQKVGSTELELFITDINTPKDQYVMYASGSVKGKPSPAASKSLMKLILKLEELGIAKPDM